MYTEQRDFGGGDTSDITTQVTELFADETATSTAPNASAEPTKRTPPRQRMNEYRETFLTIPKIVDRKHVFISLTLRDEIDEITRKLGGRGMSVSGFIENLVRHHLEGHRADLERWRKI